MLQDHYSFKGITTVKTCNPNCRFYFISQVMLEFIKNSLNVTITKEVSRKTSTFATECHITESMNVSQ